MLLPFPFLRLAEDSYHEYAVKVYDFAVRQFRRPAALEPVSTFISTIVPYARTMADDILAVTRHLLKEAEQRENEEESLLGFRLALSFLSEVSARDDLADIYQQLENHCNENVRLMALSTPRVSGIVPGRLGSQ